MTKKVVSILARSQDRLVFFLISIVDQNCLNFHYKRVFFIYLARKLMLGDGNLTGMTFHALKELFKMTKK